MYAISLLVPFLAGEGWLNMLPFWLPRLRRKHTNRKKINPIISANPTTAATTMPAIAPPDSFFELLATAEADGDDVDFPVGVGVEKDINAVIVGNLTPAHLFSASEL